MLYLNFRGKITSSYWFGLVWFYGISTLVSYLMPNSVYTYLLDIYMICKQESTKVNGSKYCYVSLTIQLKISHLFTHGKNTDSSISINSIYHKSFVCAQSKCQTSI